MIHAPTVLQWSVKVYDPGEMLYEDSGQSVEILSRERLQAIRETGVQTTGFELTVNHTYRGWDTEGRRATIRREYSVTTSTSCGVGTEAFDEAVADLETKAIELVMYMMQDIKENT